MKLEDYLNKWSQLLLQEGTNENPRLAIYQEFVWGHYEGSLEKMYPRLSQVYSFNWETISRDYYKLFPPTAYDLNEIAKKTGGKFVLFYEGKRYAGESAEKFFDTEFDQ
jgi:hypothetical protein